MPILGVVVQRIENMDNSVNLVLSLAISKQQTRDDREVATDEPLKMSPRWIKQVTSL